MIEQAISGLAVTGFFAAAGGYFLWQLIKLQTLKRRGVTATATITSKTAVSNGYAGKFSSPYNFIAEYEFTANDGKTYTRKLQNIRKPEFDSYSEGGQIEIIYSAKNPANNCPSSKLSSQNVVMILFLAGCCYTVFTYITNLKI